jgi:hypothetical protein
MSIHDFHSRFAAADEGSTLLAVLRKLSLEDPKGALFGDIFDPSAGWDTWPPVSASLVGAD